MQLNDMFDQMRSDCVAICASPFHESGLVSNVPKWRLTLSKGAAFLYSCVLNHKFSSYTSCFRIYRREALEAMELRFGGFSYKALAYLLEIDDRMQRSMMNHRRLGAFSKKSQFV